MATLYGDPNRWESYGSETEVAKEQVVNKRQKLHLVFQRRLKDFGGPLNFSDSNAAENKTQSTEFAPYEDKSFNIHIKQINKGNQIVRSFQNVTCQTDVPESKNIWTQYYPREFTKDECDEITKSQSFADFVLSVSPRLEKALKEKEIVDVFKDDYEVFKPFRDKVDPDKLY